MTDAPLDAKLLAAVDRLGRALRAARQSVATDLDLSVLGLHVLERLATGAPTRVGRLAAELSVAQPTATDAVASLEARDLVRRGPDPADARARVVALTPEGRRVAQEVATRLGPVGRSAASSPDDQATALGVLLAEIARLHDVGVIEVDRSCLTCHHHELVGGGHARCLLLDRPLRPADLRVDCPEHQDKRRVD